MNINQIVPPMPHQHLNGQNKAQTSGQNNSTNKLKWMFFETQSTEMPMINLKNSRKGQIIWEGGG